MSDDDDFLEDEAADEHPTEEDYEFIDDEPTVEEEDEAPVIHVD